MVETDTNVTAFIKKIKKWCNVTYNYMYKYINILYLIIDRLK